jgi:hypothetical protein
MICVLSHEQVRIWEEEGKRPPCKYHHHVSPRVALESIKNDEAFPVKDLRNAIVIYTSVLRYIWQGRRSAGFSTLQLAPVTGRKSPLGLCAEARKG